MGTMVLGCYLSYWFLFVLTYAIFFFFFLKRERKVGRWKKIWELGEGKEYNQNLHSFLKN
jgi:hypothetical protein